MSSGVGTAFAFFRKLFPAKALSTTSPEEIATLRREYAKWQWIPLPFLFGYVAATGYAWYLLLSYVGRLAASSHEPSFYVIVPGPIYWAVPAMLLGFISAAVPAHLTIKAMLGSRRYEEYTRLSDLQNGFDGWKAFRWLAIVFVCGSGLMVAAGLSMWVAFRGDQVILKRLWAWNAASYPYNRVKAIAHVARLKAPNGNMVSRGHYVIRFDDGETWKTNEIIDRPDPERDEQIITLVSRRSRKPIQQIDLIDDLKP